MNIHFPEIFIIHLQIIKTKDKIFRAFCGIIYTEQRGTPQEKREVNKMKLWNVAVYNRRCGWDTYMVSATDKLDAYIKCRERLDNETDHPEHWIITGAEEVQNNG